mgnify:CR=1 FL=1
MTFKVSELFSVKVSITNVAPAQSKTLAVLMNTQGEFTIGLKASKGSGLTRNLRIRFPESSTEPWVILKGNATPESNLALMKFSVNSKKSIKIQKQLPKIALKRFVINLRSAN